MANKQNEIHIPITGSTEDIDNKLKDAEKSFAHFTQKTAGEVEKYEAKMLKMAEATTGFAATASRLGNIATGVKSAFDMVSGAVSSVLGSISTIADFNDSLDKTALRTGLTVEQLSGLKFAAEQCGSGYEVAVDGIKTFNNLLGAANMGDQGSIDKLKKVGISAADFAGKEGLDSFIQLADYIAAIGDSAEQTRTAMEVFGSAGYDLLPLLQQGSAGIRALTDEAAKYSGVIGKDATTATANMNDAVNRARTALTGAWNILVVKLAPAITVIANAIANFISLVTDFCETHKTTATVIFAFVAAITTAAVATAAYQAAIALIPAAATLASVGVKGLAASLALMNLNPVILALSAVVGVVTALSVACSNSRSEADTLAKSLGSLAAAKRMASDDANAAKSGIEQRKQQLARLEELDTIIKNGGAASGAAQTEANAIMQMMGIEGNSNGQLDITAVRESVAEKNAADQQASRDKVNEAYDTAVRQLNTKIQRQHKAMTEYEKTYSRAWYGGDQKAQALKDDYDLLIKQRQELQAMSPEQWAGQQENEVVDAETLKEATDAAVAKQTQDQTEAEKQEAEAFARRSAVSNDRFKNKVRQKRLRKNPGEAKAKKQENEDAKKSLKGIDTDAASLAEAVDTAKLDITRADTPEGRTAAQERLNKALAAQDEYQLKKAKEELPALMKEREKARAEYTKAGTAKDYVAQKAAEERYNELSGKIGSAQSVLDKVKQQEVKTQLGAGGFSAFGFMQIGNESPEVKELKKLVKGMTDLNTNVKELNVGVA